MRLQPTTDLRHGVHDLIIRSWHLIDRYEGVGVEELFAEDGLLAFGDSVHEGTAAIRKIYADRRERGLRTARHIATNMLMDVSDQVVRTFYCLTLYAGDGRPVLAHTTPIAVFDVEDVVGMEGGRLKLHRRKLISVFRAADQPLAVPYRDPAGQTP